MAHTLSEIATELGSNCSLPCRPQHSCATQNQSNVRRDSVKKKRSDTLTHFAKCLAAATALVALVTTAGSAIAACFTWIVAQHEAENKELWSFGNYAELVKKHRELAKQTVDWLRLHQGDNGFCGDNARKIVEKLNSLGSGSRIYYSEEFTTFRLVHEFYEDLGLLVKREVINRELVFELVTFPTDFMKQTYCLNKIIGNHWFGRNQSIAGFSENAEYLMEFYRKKRRESALANGRPAPLEPEACPCNFGP